MKAILKVEQLFLLLLSIFLFLQLDYAWWWFLLLFLAPDISMVGYVFGPKIGAVVYNLAHHQGVAIVFYVLGLVSGSQVLQLAGLVMLGHSAFDRVLGYGLKYPDSFRRTHLGTIGASPTDAG